MIKLLEAGGWRQVHGQGKGSHRKFRHPDRPGMVIVPGHPNDDLETGTGNAIRRQAEL
ncbi:MAG TPA: type II toxin-antitoxin system HicA family toxin [Dehalococcoidia bacterium]|nr:type II toxin-antitoxin system HicA family toxin [Dehalococcoidia bacterium]